MYEFEWSHNLTYSIFDNLFAIQVFCHQMNMLYIVYEVNGISTHFYAFTVLILPSVPLLSMRESFFAHLLFHVVFWER